MKPVVSSMQAWSCTVISFFAIIILTVLALLFRSNHEQLMGSTNDPTDGKAVSQTVFTAVFVYIVRFSPTSNRF
ncbi:uncharacterized protein Triagg1_7656 [Trichoderma aggressivum f. europaeum]|uniref:Uncharacterized protein n=1 Tax=Trichoderma aggressivum f. europaeum TaxID=173218 RepID=A0AAE1J5J6_9HYPO|nr:hypothetical protein Triagg1_7656 [Trichoderma aggressivum f. europaeum]